MHALPLTLALCGWFLVRAWLRPARSVALAFGVLALDAYNRSTLAWLAEWRVAQVMTCTVVAVACLRQVALVGWRRAFVSEVRAGAWLAALFAYSALSLSWTPEPRLATREWVSSLGYLATLIIGAHVVVRDEDDLREALRETALVWTPFLVLVLLAGNWGARGVVSLIPSDHQWQGFGAGEVGYLALPTLAGIAALTLPLVPRLGSWSRFVATMLLLAIIVRSGARGQLVAAIVASVVYAPTDALARAARATARAVALLSGAFVVGVLVAPTEHSQVLIRWTLDKLAAGLAERYKFIAPLWDAFVSAGPVAWCFGLGASSSLVVAKSAPHVVPLEVLCEYGALGLALLLVSSWLVLRDIARVAREDRLGAALRAGLAVFVFLAVVSLKGGIFLRMPWLWAVYAMLARAARAAATTTPSELGSERSGAPQERPASRLEVG